MRTIGEYRKLKLAEDKYLAALRHELEKSLEAAVPQELQRLFRKNPDLIRTLITQGEAKIVYREKRLSDYGIASIKELRAALSKLRKVWGYQVSTTSPQLRYVGCYIIVFKVVK